MASNGCLFDRLRGALYSVEFIADDGVQCKEVYHAVNVDITGLLDHSATVRSLHAASPDSFRLISSDYGLQRRWRRVWLADAGNSGDAPSLPSSVIAELFSPEALQVHAWFRCQQRCLARRNVHFLCGVV